MMSFRENFTLLFSKRDRLRFMAMVLLMLAASVLEFASLGAIPLFVASLSGQASSGIPDKLDAIIQWLGVGTPFQRPLIGGLLIGVIFLFRTFFFTFTLYLQERLLSNREVELSSRLFRAYMSAPYSFHLQRNTSQILTNVQGEVARLIEKVLATSLNLVRISIIIVSVVSLLLWYDPMISLVAFSALALCGGGFMMMMNKRIGHWGWVAHFKRQETTKCISEGLGAYKEAQILGKRNYFCRQLHSAMQEMTRVLMFMKLEEKSLWPFMELITVCVILGTMSIMLLRGDGKELVAPTIALLTVCLARLKGSLTELMLNISNIKGVSGVLDAICKDLRELEAIPVLDDAMPDIPFSRDITLERLSFRYDGASHPSLSDLSLTLRRGHSLALVGPSGGGKTTLVSVLLGLLPPDQGRVLVDGLDIQGALPAWQRHIGYVAQDIFLLDDTLRANIALGIAPEDVDENALQKAIHAAQLTGFINDLPDGDKTILGERGTRLSGGQRQRVAIARALYRNPQLLIFDEATSALDVLTEQAVVSAIDHLKGSHTLIIVAHRLSTVRNCDQLAFLQNGQLQGIGSYDDLKQQIPAFRDMAAASEAALTPDTQETLQR